MDTLKRFDYRLVTLDNGRHALEVNFAYQGGKARLQLTPDETEELWRINGDMPARFAGLVPEGIWEAHREGIMAVLKEGRPIPGRLI